MATEKVFDQQKERSTVIMDDQHGREWVVTVHNKNRMPVGEMYLRSCRQPIPTPQKYVRVDPNRLSRLVIAYDEWISELLASNAMIRERLQSVAEKQYGVQAAAVLKNGVPAEILAKLGSAPIPVEFVYAMRSGESKWALGIRRADGSFYPRPKWVTDELWDRAQAALKQQWSANGFGGTLETFDSGTFADEDDATVPVATQDADEEEVPVFIKTMDAPGADFGRIGGIAPALPVKRGPGRPRKHTDVATR